jgi:hypothetical protein
MISEAVNSGKYVVVFDARGLSLRHRRFLDSASARRHIYLSGASSLASFIGSLWKDKPGVCVWNDKDLVREALERVL